MENNLDTVRKNELKVDFFAQDIKEPLNLIMCATTLLEKETKLSDDGKDNIYILKNNSRKMLRIVQNLISASQVDLDILKCRNTYGDCVEVIHKIVNIASIYAKNSNVAFRFRDEAKSVEFNFDKEKVRLIMMNLLSNAIKFSSEDSIVIVKVRTRDDKFIVSVTDSAGGIPKEKVPFIFDKFYTGVENYTKKAVGCGLGLYISRANAKAMGGDIKYTNSKRGSRFIFSIPIIKPSDFSMLNESPNEYVADRYYSYGDSAEIMLADII